MNDSNSKARSLVVLTVLACFVILAAAWFLLVSPVLAGADEANANASGQEEQNANTEIQVNKLKQQYARIDEYKQVLEALQVQIPVSPQYPELQRMFADVAGKHGVIVTALTFGAAQPFAVANPAPNDDSDITGTSDTEALPDATASPDPSDATTSGMSAVAGQYGIPLGVTVVGKYDNVMAMLRELQTATGRLVLVNNVTVTKATEPGSLAVPGAPEDADTTGVFAGQAFVLTSSTPIEEVPADSGTDASPAPSPTN